MTASVAVSPATAVPIRTFGSFTTQWGDDCARLRLLAKRIHALGPRPLLEMLLELDAGAELRPTLERYGRLAPLTGFIREHGGDRLPGPRVIDGGRKP